MSHTKAPVVKSVFTTTAPHNITFSGMNSLKDWQKLERWNLKEWSNVNMILNIIVYFIYYYFLRPQQSRFGFRETSLHKKITHYAVWSYT